MVKGYQYIVSQSGKCYRRPLSTIASLVDTCRFLRPLSGSKQEAALEGQLPGPLNPYIRFWSIVDGEVPPRDWAEFTYTAYLDRDHLVLRSIHSTPRVVRRFLYDPRVRDLALPLSPLAPWFAFALLPSIPDCDPNGDPEALPYVISEVEIQQSQSTNSTNLNKLVVWLMEGLVRQWVHLLRGDFEIKLSPTLTRKFVWAYLQLAVWDVDFKPSTTVEASPSPVGDRFPFTDRLQSFHEFPRWDVPYDTDDFWMFHGVPVFVVPGLADERLRAQALHAVYRKACGARERIKCILLSGKHIMSVEVGRRTIVCTRCLPLFDIYMLDYPVDTFHIFVHPDAIGLLVSAFGGVGMRSAGREALTPNIGDDRTMQTSSSTSMWSSLATELQWMVFDHLDRNDLFSFSLCGEVWMHQYRSRPPLGELGSVKSIEGEDPSTSLELITFGGRRSTRRFRRYGRYRRSACNYYSVEFQGHPSGLIYEELPRDEELPIYEL
ncbi:hypothetical protein GP486_007378 [Trichoglossum hirsutum]|uniref:Uncharacterized protein n=1 Tax=Trichoglossum hirsutum TaxID=265104 RepID=A0A9P8II88_9PEZI|nr:hypothetical protein GP486_007378 [Trichoglossum hirsutum]